MANSLIAIKDLLKLSPQIYGGELLELTFEIMKRFPQKSNSFPQLCGSFTFLTFLSSCSFLSIFIYFNLIIETVGLDGYLLCMPVYRTKNMRHFTEEKKFTQHILRKKVTTTNFTEKKLTQQKNYTKKLSIVITSNICNTNELLHQRKVTKLKTERDQCIYAAFNIDT